MSHKSDNVVTLRRRRPNTYAAKRFDWASDSLRVSAAGTLEGFIDLALFDGAGAHMGTHLLTCDEARSLAAKLLGAADDVQKNCLFDRDDLLIDERPAS